MTRFKDWRLRQKFMAITALAAGLPLLFYAAIPLKSSFESLKSLQKEFLEYKMNAAESVIKQRRLMLEQTASLLAADPHLRTVFFGDVDRTPPHRNSATETVNMGHFQGVDLAYIYTPGEEAELLSELPSEISVDSLAHPVENWLKSRSEAFLSTSGFSGIDGRKYLLAISRFGSQSDGSADGLRCLVLGIDLENSKRLAELTAVTQGDVSLMVTTRESATEIGTDSSPFDANELELGVKKVQKSFDPESPFLLTLYHPRGEYDEIESNQIWFFVLFLLGAYLAAVIATAGSAAVVLRPLGRLIETMRSVSGPTTYNHRASEDRKDEIGQLAINFNRLMRRLQVAQRELQIAQKHALEAEKLETVHAMVITLAHEINNPLTALLGEAEMLLMDGRLLPADRTAVEVIRNMSMRIQRVITKLQDVQEVEMTAYTDWQQMIKINLEDTDPVDPVSAS